MKKIMGLATTLLLVFGVATSASAYTVESGDTMWKIAVKHQVGVMEIINANPQISNPNLIYPNQWVNIPAVSEKNVEKQVVDLVNSERAKHGLAPLKEDWEVSRVARHKSQDMRDRGYFSHTSPTYGSPFDMMKSYGISYRSAGENIAQGQRTPQSVMNSWMNSSGHRANILSKDFTHIGVGYASGNYWTQMFIKK